MIHTFHDRVYAQGYAGIQAIYEKHGYRFYTKDNSINIFGVRNSCSVADMFDDIIGYVLMKDGKPEISISYGTTDPGLVYLKNPLSEKGTAILVPGQYKGAYVIGTHAKNKKNFAHEALVQTLPVKVYRDRNKDNVFDFDPSTIEEGIFGINIHRASRYRDAEKVGEYSAGCQVMKNAVSFFDFMQAVKASAKMYGNKFTYTLFTEQEFFA